MTSSPCLQLPTEVWSHVFHFVHGDPRDYDLDTQRLLNTLSQVSKQFHAAATPHLYKAPEIELDENLDRFLRSCDSSPSLGAHVRTLDVREMGLAKKYAAPGSKEERLLRECNIGMSSLPRVCPKLEVLLATMDFEEATRISKSTPAAKSRAGVPSNASVLWWWLSPDAPWSGSLRHVNLWFSRNLKASSIAQPFDASLDGQQRALKQLHLTHTDADDAFVAQILTCPSFGSLKSLSLMSCESLSDDIVDLLRRSYVGPGAVPLLEGEKAIVKLEQLELTGTYLLNIKGLGDYWVDQTDSEEEEDEDEDESEYDRIERLRAEYAEYLAELDEQGEDGHSARPRNAS